MYDSKKWLASMLAFSFLLSGCSGSSMFEKELNQAKAEADTQPKVEKSPEEQLDDWKEFYSNLDSESMDETLAVYEKTVEQNDISFEVKDQYKDKDEFARLVAHILFSLRKGELNAEKYLSFMNDFGSKYYKTVFQLGEDQKADLEFAKNITEAIKQDGLDVASYQISKVIHEESNPLIGTFYIIYVQSNGKKTYEQAEVVKEEGIWKLNEVRNSGPVRFKGKGEVLVPTDSEKEVEKGNGEE
ncbi:hypothetical protein [Pseudobacillus badius]|uniref:hypothetical protein n=1 Tax=Bacillus badius TaxID=1455 RepID=UPI003D357429